MILLSFLVWIFGLVATAYLLLALAIVLLQRKLIYRPDVRRTTPEASGFAGVDEWTIDTPDGASLVAWYAHPEPGRPTVLYFHGNAGWIELRNDRLAELKSRGFGVLMPCYRGYGGSTGRPSESANIADAKIVFGCLLARGCRPSNIIIFGESLGTGIAVQLAASRPCAGVVLDSPYTSMIDIARLRYPWLPVSWLLQDRYETLTHLPGVRAPTLVIHGGADKLVPVSMGRAVHRAAAEPKALAVFAHAGHLNHLAAGSFSLVSAWIDTLPATPRASEPRPLAKAVPALARTATRPEAVPQAYVVSKV